MSYSDSLIESSDVAVPIHAVAPDGLDGLLASLSAVEAGWARATGFDAAMGAVTIIADAKGSVGRVLFGLGAATARKSAPLISGKLPMILPQGDYHFVTELPDPSLTALGWALGNYRFTRYKTSAAAAPRLVVPKGVPVAAARGMARTISMVRDLVNTPPNDLGPAELAREIHALAERYGASVSEIVGSELLGANLPLIHAVGRAAADDRGPRLVDLVWGDPDHPKVTLVGKGVTFDTGGLDIKPSSGMLLMKKDMGGAANAMGLAQLIMEARLPVRLRLLVPAVENAISGPAFRPGDVFRSRAGISVEIGNTDAEGRLILADALTLAAEESPALLIDLATLTGAARVALGPDIPPFYTHDDELAADLAQHAERVGDPLWRMPLWAPYEAMLDSKVADINNAGSGGFAGSVTAALFLDRFVPKSIPWVHADIYAWNPSSRPARPEGGEAQAIRALFSLITARFGG
ncbi:leucyl aminopeptidase family protein [Kaistia dalseonensis]|uniref:Leucyl aminopeptidase n=1 Tax=Kaistia dalseonensis TaxID=410840 RepID=A0ABU0HAN3_9HYPH|nr:leucyl aminopeptidase family protein [Kaistia dalseonensis]MCX5496310.1 leucyl aminopeptidase family protein [Kaistia dalseonensis]MDQ0438928.1 leucyl aminopeptidase [Kaistia dalseonensis]